MSALLLIAASAEAAPESAVGGGYLGEMATHPGVTVFAERSYGAGERLVLAAEVGGYLHPRSHTAPFAAARVGWRHTANSGYSIGANAGAGYVHTFIAAETVNFDNRGYPGLLVLVDVEPIAWQRDAWRAAGGLRLLGLYPVNTHWVAHPALAFTLARSL